MLPLHSTVTTISPSLPQWLNVRDGPILDGDKLSGDKLSGDKLSGDKLSGDKTVQKIETRSSTRKRCQRIDGFQREYTMQRFWRHFKLPTIVTVIALILMVISGLIAVNWIIRSGQATEERAKMLGSGLATVTAIIVAPFWIYAAYVAGKERRAELRKMSQKAKPAKPARTSRKPKRSK
jgi:hypothetical protein